MTAKDIFYNLINRKPSARYPVAFLSPHYYYFRELGITEEESFNLPAEQLADIYVNGARKIGSDIIFAAFHGTLALKALGAKVKFRQKGSSDMEEPLIKNINDLDQIDLSLLKKYPAFLKFQEATKIIKQKAKDLIICTGGSWGPFTLASLMYGADNLMRACLTDQETVRKLLDFSLKLFIANSEALVDSDSDIISVGDPVASGDMISKKVFEELALPYDILTFKWIKSQNCLSMLHVCGNISDRLDLIRESGVDILSVDYKVDLQKAASILDGKVILAGNVDPVGIIQMGTSELVTKSYEKCLSIVEGYPYFILTGCMLSPLTPPDNLAAMVKVAHSHTPKEFQQLQ